MSEWGMSGSPASPEGHFDNNGKNDYKGICSNANLRCIT